MCLIWWAGLHLIPNRSAVFCVELGLELCVWCQTIDYNIFLSIFLRLPGFLLALCHATFDLYKKFFWFRIPFAFQTNCFVLYNAYVITINLTLNGKWGNGVISHHIQETCNYWDSSICSFINIYTGIKWLSKYIKIYYYMDNIHV